MLNSFYRRIFQLIEELHNSIRRVHLQTKYGGLTISGTAKIGKNCDIRCIKGAQIKISNTTVSNGCQIIADNNAVIEIVNSFIGPNSVIVSQKGIKIGADCQIAEMVSIRDQNHNFGASGKTIVEQGFKCEQITIGTNVWIAAKATILMGVEIGNNCVIGAHSVVNMNCESNTVYAGIPARKIKDF